MPPVTSSGNSRWVDPFIGCDPAALPEPSGIAATWWCAKPPIGNTHPGATLPFGMVSACAYSGAYVTGYGKYAVSLTGDTPETLFDDHTALGIAHFQQSGTGRIRMYYNYFLTTPLTGTGLEGLGEPYPLEQEEARPGFYSGRLGGIGVDFEVTCTKRTALHRYHFPENCRGKVAVNLTSGGLLIDGMESYPEKAKARAIDLNTYRGRVLIEGIPFYFHLKCLTEVRDSGFWEDGRILDEGEEKFKATKESRRQELPFGIWFEAVNEGEPIELRISFSLHDKHRSNEALEIGSSRTFEQTAAAAGQLWDSVLGKIDVEGGTDEMREVFYTALYHSTIKPADFMDENPFAPGSGPFFFDLSTLWDLYKTQLPLVMTLWPELGKDFVTFLVEVARREGAFPVSYLMDNGPERFAKQATGLCHMILNDANMRGIEGDWDEVLRLLWKTSLSGKGRGGKFAEFAKNHVVQPLSHTLDLAFANWCIAQLAKTLGDQVIYDRSIPLSYHWRNAFDEKTGLLSADSDYYEGENWNYSFRFIHDMVGRINLAGGEKRFVELLDLFFGFAEPEPGRTVHRFEGLNNEPDMEAPYAYLFAGRHDRTAAVVRNVMKYQFTTGRGGLPGNDDSGGLSSWYVWSAVGIFPVTGLPIMLIGSPIFEKATLHLLGGDFTVIAENQGPENFYIQSAELNGQPLDRCYLKLSEFAAEATLRLKMGPEPSDWATSTRPPSFLN
ncbi:MAG: glycoside hydrolase family 92 protein [Verrucomicrobiales bacterium]|nr:glycoside hydrolase family 92 protein [Verrucomicrobiales bacterium]